MEISPENRVFHIDRECYIIYLGSDPDDYKPFLRIGNSKNLPDEIKKNIYYIVITDSLTGNPLLEPENMNSENLHENKFVGDKQSLSEFFKFLNCFSIKTEGYPITDSLETNENRAVISYFDNGNLTLHYNKKLIFDLKKREEQDLHFIELAKNIKNRLKLDPLFLGYDFFKSIDFGFVSFGSSNLYVNHGQFFADGLPENYYETLAYNRLDPDLISTLAINKADENLIRILKRKLSINERLDILTRDEDKIINCTVDLFKRKKDLFTIRSKINSNEISFSINNTNTIVQNKKSKVTIINIKDKKHRIEFSNLPAENKKTLYIDHNAKEILYKTEQEVYHHPLIEGIPYIINENSDIDITTLEGRVEEAISFFKDHIDTQQTNLLNTLKTLLKSLIKSDSYLVENYIKSSEKLIKHLNPNFVSSLLAISLLNLIKYLLLVNDDKNTLKKILKIEDRIKNNIQKSKKPDNIYIPLTANIFTEVPIIVFLLTKGGLISTDYQYSIDKEKEVKFISVSNINLFRDNKAKLIQLIEDLKGRRLFPKGAVDLKHKRIEEKEEFKTKEVRKPEKERESTKESYQVESFQKDKVKDEEVKVFAKTKKQTGSKKLTLLIILIIAVIIAAGLYTVVSRSKISKHKEEMKAIVQKEVKEAAPSEKAGNTVPTGKKQEALTAEKELSAVSESNITSKQTLQRKEISKKRIESFLDLGYIKITILDVYRLTNRIAKSNGYRTLNNPDELGKDPNWIYPGNKLKLPDNSIYTVRKGDTIWYIAKRFIKKELDIDWKVYQEIKEKIKGGNLDNKTKNNIINKLLEMRNRTYSENFKKLLEETINRLKK